MHSFSSIDSRHHLYATNLYGLTGVNADGNLKPYCNTHLPFGIQNISTLLLYFLIIFSIVDAVYCNVAGCERMLLINGEVNEKTDFSSI
jgi:hypothetical protein